MLQKLYLLKYITKTLNKAQGKGCHTTRMQQADANLKESIQKYKIFNLQIKLKIKCWA